MDAAPAHPVPDGKLAGILVSDRGVVYDGWDAENRQLGRAHVKRNWEKKIKPGGEAKKSPAQRLVESLG